MKIMDTAPTLTNIIFIYIIYSILHRVNTYTRFLPLKKIHIYQVDNRNKKQLSFVNV